MTRSLFRRELIPLGALLLAGLVGTIVGLGYHSADAQFLTDQRHPPHLRPDQVAVVVKSAPDPTTGTGHGVAATCTRHGSAPLGNPWSCVVRYRNGKRVGLAVQVHEDGTYDGLYRGVGGGGATGCCIDTGLP